MLGITHAAIGMAVGSMLGKPTDAVVCGLAALLPDIDEPDSTLGRRLPVVSTAINLLFGHRGYTHTVLFACSVAVLVNFGFGMHYAVLSLAGILSHVLLDCMTPSGCRPFLPLSHKRFSGVLRTATLLGYAIAAVGFYLFGKSL